MINQHKNEVRKRNKERVISTRISVMEYMAIKKRASDAGVTMSKYCRSILLTGKIIQRISKADAEVLRRLAGEANNLNQLARSANKDGFTNVALDLSKLRSVIVKIIKQLSNDWKSYERGNI